MRRWYSITNENEQEMILSENEMNVVAFMLGYKPEEVMKSIGFTCCISIGIKEIKPTIDELIESEHFAGAIELYRDQHSGLTLREAYDAIKKIREEKDTKK